jgi:hypothetical protein
MHFLANAELIKLEIDRDHDVSGLGWTADGGRYYFLRTSRDLRRIQLRVADRFHTCDSTHRSTWRYCPAKGIRPQGWQHPS